MFKMPTQPREDVSTTGCRMGGKAIVMCVTPRYSLVLMLCVSAAAQAGPRTQLPPLDDGRGKQAQPAPSPENPAPATNQPTKQPKTGATVTVGQGHARPAQPSKKSGKSATQGMAAPVTPPAT